MKVIVIDNSIQNYCLVMNDTVFPMIKYAVNMRADKQKDSSKTGKRFTFMVYSSLSF